MTEVVCCIALIVVVTYSCFLLYMQMEGRLTTFSMVIEGNKQTGYSALLPDVPGFFVAGITIKEIEKETAKALPWYLDYLKQGKSSTVRGATRTLFRALRRFCGVTKSRLCGGSYLASFAINLE
jgi:predicted RNase H-like HicB family nuclease